MIYIKIRREAIKICIYIVNIYKSESNRMIRNTRATALATLRALCIFFSNFTSLKYVLELKT